MRFVRNRDSGEIFYIDVYDLERALDEVSADELRLEMQMEGTRMVPVSALEMMTLDRLEGLTDAAFEPLRRYGQSLMQMARRRKRRLRRARQ